MRRSMNSPSNASPGINIEKLDDLTRKILSTNVINPPGFDTNPEFAKFYVIKSYSEDDVHKSIKYSIWTSTDSGNRRLDKGYREFHMKGPVYLFFSVNASGQFCGIAQMVSPLDFTKKANVWNQEDKWNGQFEVKWVFIKDIPNSALRHIRLTNNENKPVTNSRDTQEALLEPGRDILKIFKSYKFKTSILDDFPYYNQQEEQGRIAREAAKRGGGATEAKSQTQSPQQVVLQQQYPSQPSQQLPRKAPGTESQVEKQTFTTKTGNNNNNAQVKPVVTQVTKSSGAPSATANSKQPKPKNNVNKTT